MPSAVRVRTASGWQDIAIQGAPGLGIPGAMVLINDTVLSADGQFLISGIPQTYAHLLVIMSVRSANAAATTDCCFRFNSDSGANYTFARIGSNDGTATADFSGSQGYITGPAIPGDTAGAGNYGAVTVLIPNYASARMHSVHTLGYAAVSQQYPRFGGGLWTPQLAINSFWAFPVAAPNNFKAGSRCTIYGLGAPGSLLEPPPIVTSLPANPADGAEIYYLADATNGIIWHLRYRAASASAYKWEFIGGSTLLGEVAAQESTTLATFTALATPGPSVTLPLAGDYIISHGAELHTGGASGNAAFMSYDIGATPASDVDLISNYIATTATEAAQCFRQKRKNGLSAVTLTAKYRSNIGGQISYYTRRTIEAKPVRVG